MTNKSLKLGSSSSFSFNFLLTFLFIITFNYSFGSKQKAFIPIVNSSNIQNINGQINLDLNYFINGESITLDSVWIESRDNYFSLQGGYESEFLGIADSTITESGTLALTYNSNDIPYYSKDLILKFRVTKNDSVQEFSETKVKIYFTPYNTVEVWDIRDLEYLPRKWFVKDTSQISLPSRTYISQNDIPVSNLDFHTIDPEIYNNDNYMEVEVPGLAYKILMQDTTTAYSKEYYGDGPDSLSLSKATYNGTISFKLFINDNNDCGYDQSINLKGIKVKLKEKDAYWSQTIDTKYTNSNGVVTFNYSVNQSFEGSGLELYFEVISETENNSNRVYAVKSWGGNYRYDNEYFAIYAPSGYNGFHLVDMDLSTHPEAFFAVHRGVKSREAFQSENVSVENPLRLRPYSNYSSHFCWDAHCFELPTIFISPGDVNSENVFYHEYGHYAMFRLQSGFSYPCNGDWFSHSGYSDDEPILAWTEGWANFVSIFLDYKLQDEDNESGRGYINGTSINPHEYSQKSHTLSSNMFNGFLSEHYIGQALFDLYDGNGPLPMWCSGSGSFHDQTDPSTTQYYDFRSIDNVSIPLETLCYPFAYNADNNLKQDDVGEYLDKLFTQLSDVNEVADATRVLRENYICWSVQDYDSGNLPQSYEWDPSTNIGVVGNFLENKGYSESFFFCFNPTDISVNVRSEIPTNLSTIYLNQGSDYITGEFWLDNTSNNQKLFVVTLGANLNPVKTANYTLIDLRTDQLSIGREAPIPNQNNQQGHLIVQNNSGLRVRANSNLLITEESTLDVKQSSYFIAHANSTITVKGKLHFKQGSNVCIDPDANIIIEEDGELIIDDGVNFQSPNYRYYQGNIFTDISNCSNPNEWNVIGDGALSYSCSEYYQYTHDQEYVVSSYEVWDGNDPLTHANQSFKKNIIVEPNQTLRLRNLNLEFNENSGIIVKAGGRLDIDDCNLTSIDCENILWQGIQVFGQPNVSPGQQAVLTLNDSYISNAVIGVANAKMISEDVPSTSTQGGRTYIYSNVFENNRRDVAIFPYNGLYDIYVDVNNNTFRTTNELNDNHYSYSDHVLVNWYRVNIKNNVFETVTNFNFERTGIRQNSSTLSIIGNEFNKLNYGIYGFSVNQLRTLKIKENEFDCRVGAYLNNIDYLEIESNILDIGESSLPLNFDQICWGIELDHCSNYVVQENEFNGNTQGVQTLGLSVINSNSNVHLEDNNEIYNNNFDLLTMGSLAMDVNRNRNGSKGLVYKCNTFTNNSDFDLVVSGDNLHEGIKTFQGSCLTANSPSNNQYSRPVPNFGNAYVSTNIDLLYFFLNDGYQAGSEIYPTELQNSQFAINLTCTPLFDPNTQCPSEVDDGTTIGGLIGVKQTFKDDIGGINGTIDGGSTDGVISSLQSLTQDYQIKNYLLDLSPGLSDEVLISLIEKTPYVSDYVIQDVLMANAPITDRVWERLIARQVPVGDYIIKNLAYQDDIISQENQLLLINNNNYPEWLIKDLFTHFSPLSDEVLIALLDRNPYLSDWVIKQIFVENTPLSQNVSTELNARIPAVQQWVINAINNSNFVADDPKLVSQMLSEYEEKLKQIEEKEFKIDKIDNELIRRYIFENDSTNNYMDSIWVLIKDTVRKEEIVKQSDYYNLLKNETMAQQKLTELNSLDTGYNNYVSYRSKMIQNDIVRKGCEFIDSCNNLSPEVDYLAQIQSEYYNEVLEARQILKYINNEYGGEHFYWPSLNQAKSLSTNSNSQDNMGGSNIDFDIYPNPTNGLFTLNTNQKTDCYVEIFDNSGRKIFESELTNRLNTINLSEFSKGIYLLKVKTLSGENLGVRKLILN